MHKGVILLVKPEGEEVDELRDEAKSLAEDFLEAYGSGDVWDWYVIGGRWSGLLTGYEPTEDPRNIEHCTICNGTGSREWPADCTPEWQKECNGCNGCNGTGKSVKFSFVEVDDNIMPMSDTGVKAKVKEYGKDWKKEQLAHCDEMDERYKDEEDMKGYALKTRGSILSDDFSFDSNVYDTVNESNAIPEDLTGYWAVVVDMHN